MVYARLSMLVARKANTAVIFRRGPSMWVQVLKWNTETDIIEQGQWFHGRIYPYRGDLSPLGDYMIYFAAKFNPNRAFYSWTAISKPPFLTAIAIWKKHDTFDGGGLFRSDREIYLNHRKEEAYPADYFIIKKYDIAVNETSWPVIYDIAGERMKRDNWVWENTDSKSNKNADVTYFKKVDEQSSILVKGVMIKEPYEYEWSYYLKLNNELIEIEDVQCFDVSLNKRILICSKGCLYAIDDVEDFAQHRKLSLVADLNNHKPYEMVAPLEMQRWGELFS